MRNNLQTVHQTRYPVIPWRFFWDLLMCLLPIAFGVLLTTRVSIWFYPLSALLIANRLLALSLLGHEGVHGTLVAKREWNDHLARWICCYPTFMSLTEYRKKHFMHHAGLGSKNWDPDRHLYDFYPLRSNRFALRLLSDLVTFRLPISFYHYYVRPRRSTLQNALRTQSKTQDDFLGFCIFHVVLLISAIALHELVGYLVFYVIPLFCLMQPYIILMGGLQHGPMNDFPDEQKSRSIVGKKAVLEVFLPCDIGFHAEHHLNPGVPHYWLAQFSEDLASENKLLRRTTYLKAIGELFGNGKMAVK